jgi:hypothetical protein
VEVIFVVLLFILNFAAPALTVIALIWGLFAARRVYRARTRSLRRLRQ